MNLNYGFFGALSIIYQNSKKSAKTRKEHGRTEAAVHDITRDDLVDLWKKQSGFCYYSQIPMQYDKNEFRVSLERLDINKGYIKDNIVLCCLEFNSKTQWSHQKIDEMIDILDKKIELSPVLDDPNKISSMLGHLEMLHHFSKISTDERRKATPHRDCSYDIDFKDVLKLYIDQNGLCAYSKIPLNYGSHKTCNWVASLKRIDSSLGHTKDNVCLICMEFNSQDQTINLVNKDAGTAAWSPKKFAMVLAYIKYSKNLITDDEFIHQLGKSEFVPACKNEVISSTAIRKDDIQHYMDIRKKERKDSNLERNDNESRLKLADRKNFYEIFMIKSPSGKKFIGHGDINISLLNAERIYYKMGVRNKAQTRCSLLKEALQDEDLTSFNVVPLLVCKSEMVEHYENKFIEEYKTLAPRGLNVELKAPRTHSTETRQQIAKTLAQKNKEKRKQNAHPDFLDLPDHVRLIDWKDCIGFILEYHPKMNTNTKKFVYAKTKPDMVVTKDMLEGKLQDCKDYLQKLEGS